MLPKENRMPRKRIHSTPAEKQKKYRERAKISVTKRLQRAHNEWMKSKNAQEFDRFEHSPDRIFYFVLVDNKFRIQLRYFDSTAKHRNSKLNEVSCVSKEEATKLFDEIKNGIQKTLKAWDTVDDRLSCAQKFIEKYDSGKTNFSPIINLDINFIFALAEISDNTPTKEKSNTRRNIAKLCRDIPLSNDARQIKSKAKEIFTRIANDVNEEGYITDDTYKSKTALVLDAFKTVARYNDIFPEVATSIDAIEEIRKDIREKYNYDEEKEIGTIVAGDHFKYIEYPDLIKILNLAYELSPAFFNFCLLGLSTGLRPTELLRLIQEPSKYIKENGFLNYSDGQLITKTNKKIDMSLITNPEISLVSRLILFHEKIFYDKDFFKNKEGEFRAENPELKKYVLRSFRTTCATMIAYCDKLTGFGRASFRDAQNRLGHKTLQMVVNIYAIRSPSSKSPINYFNNFLGKININGCLITEHCNLWDAVLLKIYLEKKFEDLKNVPEELERWKKICLTEAEKFNNAIGANISTAEVVSF